MPHTIEEAKSGRSKCRGCKKPIEKGALRFGERLPNPFADDSEMTLWFHIICGAMCRPVSFEEMLEDPLLIEKEKLRELVAQGVAHYRLARIAGVEKASSSRAKCRHCREPIAQADWRIPLMFFEEGMFNSSGFIHVSCGPEYFGTAALLPRLAHFHGELAEDELEELAGLLP